MFAACPLYPQKRTSELSREMSALCQKWTLCSAAKSVAFNTPGADKRPELFFAPFASEERAGGPGLNWRTWNRTVGAENTTCSLLRPQSLTATRTFVGDQAGIHRHPLHLCRSADWTADHGINDRRSASGWL